MATLLEYDEHVVNPRFYGTAPIALPRVSPASKSRPAFAGPMRSEMVSSTIGVKGHVLGTYDRHVLSDRDGGGRGGRDATHEATGGTTGATALWTPERADQLG